VTAMTRLIPDTIIDQLQAARFRLKLAYDMGWTAKVAETLEEIDNLLDEVNGKASTDGNQE
jgi:hypothetical protein